MKILALFFSVFLSSISFAAEWGDTFFCEMTHNSQTTAQGDFTQHNLEKFKFQLNKEKGAMIFGKSGLFSKSIMTLKEEYTWLELDRWDFELWNGTGMYGDGLLLLSLVSETDGIISVTAECDNFK